MPEFVIPDLNNDGQPQPQPQPQDFGNFEFEGTSYKLDKDGNALDDKGEIFKSKADIDSINSSIQPELEPEKVDIDGVVYTIDKNGNALDDTGTVKYTKEQIDGMSEPEVTGTLDVSNIIKSTAIPIYDDKGNEVVYENNENGLRNYITDVNQTSYNQGQVDFQNSLLNEFPIIQDVLTHLRLHGNLKEFNETPDYSKVTIEKDNVNQQSDVVIQARIIRGDTPEKARDYVQYLKDGKRLEEEATSELAYLNKHYTDLRKNNQSKLDEIESANQKQFNEYWGVEVKNNQLHPINKVGSVYDIVTKGEITIGNDKYTIPEKIRYNDNGTIKIANRQDFFNYLYAPIQVNTENGPVVMTGDQYRIAIEQQQRTIGHDVLDAFKRFVGYDMTQLIQQEIQRQKVNEIRKLKSSGSDPGVTIKDKNKTNDPIVIKRT